MVVKSHLWKGLVCCLALPLLLIWGFSAAADVEEHFVHVRFSDFSGTAVTDIAADEIRVTADGEPLQITRIMGPEEPFHVGLLMDVSPSKEEEVDPIRTATSDFISYFPERNPILLLTFDSEVYVDCDWTTDRKRVDEAIWEFGLHKPGGSTILRDALVSAVQQKFQPKGPRTAMVLFSDGVDTGSEVVSKEDSFELLRQAGVLTYVIQHFSMKHHWRVNMPAPENPDLSEMEPPRGGKLGPIFVGGNPTERDMAEYKIQVLRENASQYLRRLARAGGGRLFPVAGVDELTQAYETIGLDLLEVYTVFFRPAKRVTAEARRQIRASVTRNDVFTSPYPSSYPQ